MAIRITDVEAPNGNYSKLRIHSAHGYVDLTSHAAIIKALGHTGITFIPRVNRHTEYLRSFLVGRIARVDKSQCQVTTNHITLLKQKHLFTIKWKKGVKHGA